VPPPAPFPDEQANPHASSAPITAIDLGFIESFPEPGLGKTGLNSR
jgi:hypothetical protein